MKIKALLAIAVLLTLISGCGMHAAGVSPGPSYAAGHDNGSIKAELYSQYDEWRGVRYRSGGLTKKGVDCSGFVYVTYRSKFGIKLPRTTRRMSEAGEQVKRSSLRTGDLVFFKTGARVRHVGIYLEKGRFLHASKKRGVMISRLDDIYWKPRFWEAVRIEEL